MSKVKLGDIVCRIKDSVDKDNTDLIYYIGGEHFDNKSLTITRKGIIKGSTIGPAFSTKFKAGDVLLMSRNPHLRKAGMVNFDGICSDVSYIIRTRDENVIMQKFIPILFQSDIFWEFAERNKKGSTNFFLNWSDFERFEFDLPDIKTQQKLCNELWSINDTIDSYKEMIKQSDELIKAKFIEMFGDIKNNSKNYPIVSLNEIAKYWNGLTYKPTNIVENNGTLVLRSSNIQNGELSFDNNVYVDCNFKEKLYVQKNDILMCSRNGSSQLVGKVALIREVNDKMSFGAFMMIIRSQYYPYLKVYFEDSAFRNQIFTGTATINQITGNMLNNISLPKPDLKTVNAFDLICQDIYYSKCSLIKSIQRLSLLYEKILTQNLRREGN